MDAFFSYTIFGLYIGAAYAIAASGLVLTYTTTRVFNLAHGATSMLMAYIYWQLHVQSRVPTLLAVALVLLVIAPLYGVVLERLIMRDLGNKPVSVSLVVTVALFVFLIGLATQFWPSDEQRSVPYFFGIHGVTLFGTLIAYHYLLTMAIAAAVAVGLYFLLNRTRIGTAMRATVDNRELVSLFGASPNRVSMLSWALGSSLSALGGVVLVAYTGLDYYTLTFLVIASFSAAMLGRLRSLPLTFAGAVVLGVGQAYVQGYVQGSAYLQTGIQSSLPTFLLFAIVLFVPQVRLRVGQIEGISAARVPSGRQATVGGAAMLVALAVVLSLLGEVNTVYVGEALAYGMIMLSLVLLTGYGGYVSLCQLTFAGVGAAVVAKMTNAGLTGLALAFVLAAAVGVVVALPVLRLTGLYLALATLAFGQLMDKLVFQADFMFGYGATIPLTRLSLFGVHFHDHLGGFVFFSGVLFVLVAMALLALRRGSIGNVLIALRDSQMACSTLGLNFRWLRVALFSLSAGIAGLGGALYANLHEFADPAKFSTLQSLPLLLIAVVAGATSMSGALVAGVLLMLLPVLQANEPKFAGLVFVVIAAGAFMLARDPNGLVNLGFRGLRSLTARHPVPGQRWFLGGGRPGRPAGTAAPREVAEADAEQRAVEVV